MVIFFFCSLDPDTLSWRLTLWPPLTLSAAPLPIAMGYPDVFVYKNILKE